MSLIRSAEDVKRNYEGADRKIGKYLEVINKDVFKLNHKPYISYALCKKDVKGVMLMIQYKEPWMGQDKEFSMDQDMSEEEIRALRDALHRKGYATRVYNKFWTLKQNLGDEVQECDFDESYESHPFLAVAFQGNMDKLPSDDRLTDSFKEKTKREMIATMTYKSQERQPRKTPPRSFRWDSLQGESF